MRTTRKTAVATVAVLALTGLTACSAATSAANKASNEAARVAAGLPADALAALGMANTHLQSENSAKITGTIQQPGQATAEQVTGAMSWGSDARLTGSISGAPGISQFSTDGSVPVLLTGGVMYMKLTNPTMISQVGGKDWMKLDFAEIAALSKNAQASSLGSGMDNMLKQMSPVQSVRALSSDKGVRDLGAETMDGQHTTHFSGHVTLDQILAAVPGLTASQRSTLAAADAKVGLTGEDVDIWLNDQALPVRVHEHTTTDKGDMDVDRHFSDYGVPVSVTVPSAADTLDLAQMIKGAAAGS